MRPWTVSEVKVLRLFASLGGTAVGKLLERSVASVEAQAKVLGVSLKMTGEDINVDETVLALLHKVSETPTLHLCPMCARRWATMRETGVCRPCHLDRLIALHKEQADVEVRQRTLAAARKDKQRRLEGFDD